MADPAKFQQINWHLFKHAIKFTGEDGRITITSANHLPHILTLGVVDSGIGIESEIMEKIFNPFEQGERSFQRRFGGIGLGLTISKSLAQAHGASLVAKSDGLNRGATFLLTIKTAELDEAETPRPAEPPRAPAGLRILLVDDQDRKSTRLNSSHVSISYAVFCLKKKSFFNFFCIKPNFHHLILYGCLTHIFCTY